jgi:hypothetical protein
MDQDGDEEENTSLLEDWGQLMYPELCTQFDSHRLIGRGGSIKVKRKFEGQQSLSHLKVCAQLFISDFFHAVMNYRATFY